jgi:8-oxo-dGTP pyrophosphatase MutT (NUDIX family)
MQRFSCLALVDARGWVLLQERDEHAQISPERWGYPGGHLEDGEEYAAGAVRELEEETGLVLGEDDLTLHEIAEVHHPETGTDDQVAIFAAATTVTDADIDCREGRRIIFVDPATLPTLPLTDSCGETLPRFLASDLYRSLVASLAP